jgi:DNA-binding response OmpR family regulator
VCRRLRAISRVPIIMLTARGEDTDRIVGLELGADDYLPKPFNPRELLARLAAVLRRTSAGGHPDGEAGAVLRFGALEIDQDARAARVNGRRKDLTARQFDLLLFLARRAGRVQSRDQIMAGLSGHEWDSVDRSIDVHISRIRSAIEEDPRKPRYVQTMRGAGYVFTPPARPPTQREGGRDRRGDGS